jgi:hypothetical protein
MTGVVQGASSWATLAASPPATPLSYSAARRATKERCAPAKRDVAKRDVAKRVLPNAMLKERRAGFAMA